MAHNKRQPREVHIELSLVLMQYDFCAVGTSGMEQLLGTHTEAADSFCSVQMLSERASVEVWRCGSRKKTICFSAWFVSFPLMVVLLE